MSIKQRLKNHPSLYTFIFKILISLNYFTLLFKYFFPRYKITEGWKKRIERVKQCPDNDKINHVQDSGKLFTDYQLMHNGLKIALGSYYDYGITNLLLENKGVHEPEEEYAFQEILKCIPKGGCMLELGSYWAFYSMWFASVVEQAKCIMIEPDPHKINFGKLNFKMNGLSGTFDLGFIGNNTILDQSIPHYSVDHLIKNHKIEFLHLLHCDIQGHELNMLQGCTKAIADNKIGYVFISTHSNPLHYECSKFLTQAGFKVLCSYDLDQTSSWDGLIIAKSNAMTGIESL